MLLKEPAAPKVRDAVERRALVSWINLGEALYVLVRRGAPFEVAEPMVSGLTQHVTAEIPDPALIKTAAWIKSAHRLSYADAYAVATAERHRLPLLTGDPEITALDRPGLEVVDLR